MNPATPHHASFADFEAALKAQGYDEILVREWAPGQVLDTHSHPFELHVEVVRGEVWLGTAEGTRHVAAGGHFDLAFEAPHSERYGPEGATFWVARRHAR